MANYSYDEFKKRLEKSGVYMSDADLALAQRDPDAGMSLISYKQDHANAKTDEARALANQGAENIRSTYGGYTAGASGSSFYKANPTPASFVPKETGTWEDPYKGKYDELLDAVINPEEFSYDHNDDESYKAYEKAYRREGDRAAKNAVTEASARTGGVASSYAATAAAQAGNYYASQLSDKIPQLYDAAYNRYLQEFQMKQAALTAVGAARQMDRNVFESDRAQVNYENEFGYGQHLDQIGYMNDEYKKQLDFGLTAADSGDFSFLRKMGIDTSQAEALYKLGVRGQELENELSNAALQGERLSNSGTEFGNALAVYNGTGDTSALRALGIANTDDLDAMWQTQVENYIKTAALELAQIGVNIDKTRLANATSRASLGDFSALRMLGVDTSGLEAEYAAIKQYESTLRQQEVEMNTAELAGANESDEITDAEIAIAEAAVKGGYATRDDYDTLIAAGYSKVYINSLMPETTPTGISMDDVNTVNATVSYYKELGYSREDIEKMFSSVDYDNPMMWAVFEAALDTAFAKNNSVKNGLSNLFGIFGG